MKIGENIKMYRKKYGFTQEYLAGQLNVSTTAVCKWESNAANPDITLLIPIAKIFNISVDKLLGYDNIQEESEIDRILNEYSLLNLNGLKTKAKALITEARMTFPTDYRIMNEYMWNIVGGRNVKCHNILSLHYSELNHICDKILDGCKNEKIRFDAISMKAKLLYVSGQSNEAKNLLNSLPGWGCEAEQKIEQLYEPEMEEAGYWRRRNMYCLSEELSNKLLNSIWNENNLCMENKVANIIELGKLFHNSWLQTKQNVFVIMEHMVFAALAKKLLISTIEEDETVKIIFGQLNAAKMITNIAASDKALADLLIRTYKTDNLLRWTITYFETADHDAYKKIRTNPSFSEMLSSYKDIQWGINPH